MPIIRIKVPRRNTGAGRSDPQPEVSGPAMAAESEAVDTTVMAPGSAASAGLQVSAEPPIVGPEAAGPAQAHNEVVDAAESANPTKATDSNHPPDSSETANPTTNLISFDFEDFGDDYYEAPTYSRHVSQVSPVRYCPILPKPRPDEPSQGDMARVTRSMANNARNNNAASTANAANAANMGHPADMANPYNAAYIAPNASNAGMGDMAYMSNNAAQMPPNAGYMPNDAAYMPNSANYMAYNDNSADMAYTANMGVGDDEMALNNAENASSDSDGGMSDSDSEPTGIDLYALHDQEVMFKDSHLWAQLDTDLPFTPVDIDLLPDFKLELITRVVTVTGRMLGVVGLLYPLATFCLSRVPVPQSTTIRVSGRGMAKMSALLPPAVAEQQKYMLCLRMRDWPSGGVAAFPDTRENRASLREVEEAFDQIEYEVWIRRAYKFSVAGAGSVLKVMRGYEGANGPASRQATAAWFRRNPGGPEDDAAGRRALTQHAFGNPRHAEGTMATSAVAEMLAGLEEDAEEEGAEEEEEEEEGEEEEEEVVAAPVKGKGKGKGRGRAKGKGRA
ncbi:hypothetical protein B0H67DRAFT_657690 [Lasiosphaeris hirsuta]|uniref:Uncharacterized protein n=1 Tax=Lasiosphaeris hirsuta TaxID=260670 RepID=A0AA40AZI5_9PEZI|nr:hypothetical protein B0H67DRAFT_657690 [Lasiosphaeris hirsuta]